MKKRLVRIIAVVLCIVMCLGMTGCTQSMSAMFTVKKTTIDLPEHARIFESYKCECCGETAGANWIRLSGGKKLCVDCYTKYDRFDV